MIPRLRKVQSRFSVGFIARDRQEIPEDGEVVLEAQSTMEQLAPQQFADRIKLMLEANPSLLDEETSAELMRVFSARPDRVLEPAQIHLPA